MSALKDSIEQRCAVATAAAAVVLVMEQNSSDKVMRNYKTNLCASQQQHQQQQHEHEHEHQRHNGVSVQYKQPTAATATATSESGDIANYAKQTTVALTKTTITHSSGSNSSRLTTTKSSRSKRKRKITTKTIVRTRRRRGDSSSLAIIVMTLVFSIIQQIQQHQQQQQQQQEQHAQHNNNAYFWAPFAVAAATTQTQMPQATRNSSNNKNELESENESEKKMTPTEPQTDTTNHTFTSLAYIDGAAAAALAAAAAASSSSSFDDMMTGATSTEAMPIFDFGMPRNITGRTGHTEAIIKCRVDRLNDKSVSWIRKRDLHILTVGTATYTSDKRFQVTESKDSREWTLHVRSPQARDTGIYECQVNTEPKMSMAFQLNIIEISPDARAIISGPADLHFKVGSAIILNCLVQQPSVKNIGPIYWYRGEHMITPFDADDGVAATAAVLPDVGTADSEKDIGIHIHSAADEDADNALNDLMTNDIQKDFAIRIAMESQLGDTLKSRLRISNAQTTDTGNYTCQPTTASSASVMVHVINDENPAAMQKSAAAAAVLVHCGRSMLGMWLTILLLLKAQLIR